MLSFLPIGFAQGTLQQESISRMNTGFPFEFRCYFVVT